MCFSCNTIRAAILSELHEEPRRKDWVTQKSTWVNLSEGHHFLATRSLSFLIFCLFPPFCLLLFYVENIFLLLQQMGGEGAGALPPQCLWSWHIKGALSGMRQFLATESPLNMMKIFFYFFLKALFALKISTVLFWTLDHV